MAKKKKAPLAPATVLGLLRELRSATKDVRPLAIGGAPGLAAELRRELTEGGEAHAVRTGSPKGAAALIYALSGPPGAAEVAELRAAHRAGVPIIAVTDTPRTPIPYVLATDVVSSPSEVPAAIARKLGNGAAPLAARLPVLREAVCARLVESFARKNALVGAAVWIPGADMPIMTLNQMRLVMRLAAAHGLDPEPARAAELVGVIGGGLGLRYVGRSLLGMIPIAGFAVRAGVGYAGTKGVGEAATRYYAQQE